MFTGLLNHTAELIGILQENINGRIRETPVMKGRIECRFAAPVTSYTSVFGNEFEGKLSAIVYCDYNPSITQPALAKVKFPNLSFINFDELEITDIKNSSGTNFFLRLETESEGWSGKYQVTTPITLCEQFSLIHHIEFGVSKIGNPDQF